MSEKRFVQCEIEYGFANTTNIKKIDGIYDMQEEKTYRIEQIVDVLNEQQATIINLQDKLFAMQHTIDNQENAIFHLKDTDDNLRKKNIKIEELSKVVHNLKMVLSNDDEQVAKIVGEQQATIDRLKNAIRIAYEEKPYPKLEDIKDKFKELQE